MRRWVILMPDALESEGEKPLFDANAPVLKAMGAKGRVFRVSTGTGEVPEAEWLGLDPAEVRIAPGPLAVAALGAEPPSRSVRFCLRLLSTDGTNVEEPGFEPEEDEGRIVFEAAKRLETARLKLIQGHGLEHALVWEDGSIDLACRTPAEAVGEGLSASLPEGDGELILRRLIDDSVNLLSELELNAMRLEEGLPPLNLLWPWGPGFAPALPNLAVERGSAALFESSSMRLSGLCRMTGYRHGDPWGLGKGTNLKLEGMLKSALASALWVGMVPGIVRLGARNEEESAWLGAEVLSRLAEPLFEAGRKQPAEILLVATDGHGLGLGLAFHSEGPPEELRLPFAAEVAHDRRISVRPLHQVLAEALSE